MLLLWEFLGRSPPPILALAGKFNMDFRDIMMSEIMGALGGIPHEERVAKQISHVLFEGHGRASLVSYC